MPPRAKHREPFAHRLVQIRKAQGLSQNDLAKRTGISSRMIAHYEVHVKYPTADVVMRLAKALNVTIDQLMGNKPVKIKEEVSRKTIKNAKLLEELSSEDQKTIIRMIDRLHSMSNKNKGNK